MAGLFIIRSFKKYFSYFGLFRFDQTSVVEPENELFGEFCFQVVSFEIYEIKFEKKIHNMKRKRHKLKAHGVLLK